MEIKGTKEGILITISNKNWAEAKKELIKQIDSKQDFFRGAHLVLDVGNHLLYPQDLGELCDDLLKYGIALSTVLSLSKVTQATAQSLGLKIKDEHSRKKPNAGMKPLDTVLVGQPATMFYRTMRSGFKVAYDGHVIVLGDVNPGAEIIASGCVIVWGRLRGTVHAGADGDEDAVVCALDLSPMQLRIGSRIATTPQDQAKPRPEVASIKEGQIVAEPWSD